MQEDDGTERETKHATGEWYPSSAAADGLVALGKELHDRSADVPPDPDNTLILLILSLASAVHWRLVVLSFGEHAMSIAVRGPRPVTVPTTPSTAASAPQTPAEPSRPNANDRRSRDTSPAAQQQARSAMGLMADAAAKDKAKATAALDALLKGAAAYAASDPEKAKAMGGARDLLQHARSVDPKLLETPHAKALLAQLPGGLDAAPGSKEAQEAAQRAAFQAHRQAHVETTKADLQRLATSLSSKQTVAPEERMAIESKLRATQKLDPKLLTDGPGKALAARFPEFSKAGVAVGDSTNPDLARRADEAGNRDGRVTAEEYQRLSDSVGQLKASGFGGRREAEDSAAAATAANALRNGTRP